MIRPIIFIQDNDFNSAWARAVRQVILNGKNVVIGSESEKKPIRDVCSLIELTGGAITQIENRQIHPQFPFKEVLTDMYCKEFTREYLDKYMFKSDEERFTYLYFERLVFYSGLNETIDQLKVLCADLKTQIETGVLSNRDQGIIWEPAIDIESDSPPCLQRIWIRLVSPPQVIDTLDGDFVHKDGEVEIHCTWRSRDLFSAWQVNYVALIEMLNREVLKPNHCKIVRLVDFVNSLHIYISDIEAAKQVKLVRKNPQMR